jgi:hypothetical protein
MASELEVGKVKIAAIDGQFGLVHENATGIKVGTDTNTTIGFIGTISNHPLKLMTNNGGHVTVGTNGDVTFSGWIAGATGANMLFGDGSKTYIQQPSASGSLVVRKSSGAEIFTIDSSGNATVEGGDLKIKAPAGNQTDAELLFSSPNNSAYGSTFAIDSKILSTANQNDNAYGSKLKFYTSNNSDVVTERLSIDSSGNAIIGTGTAGRLLELSNATNPALRINNGNSVADIGVASSAGALLTGAADDDLVIARNGAYGISVGTNGDTRLSIASDGLLTAKNAIALDTDTTPDTSSGQAFVYKHASNGTTVSGYNASIETGSAGSRASRLSISSTGAVDIAGAASHATALTVGNSTGGTELQVIPKENESITLNSAEGVTAHALILATGGTSRLTVASGGLCTFANGIAFSQTNSSATGATATGTTLDHYEEGTFTPTAWDNDTTQITTSIAVGRYVRIGRMCHVSLRLKRNDTMTGASNVYFRGLPFSSQNEGTTNDTKNIGIGGCWLPSDTEHGMAYALPGTANFIFIDAKAADGGYLTTADWGNTYNWYAAFTYEVA